jgi:nucleoside-diphosphate-sugar epimerase
MHYLVTGGAGFIGSNIVEELLRRGEKVRVLDNLATGKRENLEGFTDRIEFLEGDIRNYHIVREAVEGVDVILHQAALPSVPRSVRDPITSNQVNVDGTLNILHAAKEAKVKRVVSASSSSVYGDTPTLPKHEGMTPKPLSPYAVSKLAGETYSRVFHGMYGLETIALRYFNVFGPRQDPSSQYSAVIPKFIRAMLQDRAPVIYGDGTQSRDFTYVANVVEANIRAATAACETGITMNCACHGQVTLLELVEALNAILGKNIQPEFSKDRPGDIKHSFADIELMKKALGFTPPIDFRTGLQLTCQFYRRVGA